MQLTSQQTLAAPIHQVWDALNDTDILKECIPGCETLTQVDPNEYELQILAAVGPVKARFKGKLQLNDLQPPQSYTLQFEGQGGPAGHGKGQAQVSLESVDARQTVLHYTVSATVGGKIAQIGQRLVDMAAQRMAAEFFSNFEKALPAQDADAKHDASPDGQEGAPAPMEPAPKGLLAWLKSLWRKVAG